MIRRSRHPHDEHLFSCYVAARNGELIDPPVAEHLSDCPECSTRFDALARFMDELHTDAERTVEALFPADRLEAQRAQIVRRIDHLGQAARVISFPARTAEASATASATRRTARWVAVAAAAGLFVGLTVGTFTSLVAPVEPVEVAVSQPAAGDPVTLRLPMDEESFLRELELARDRQRARALMPLDAFTPSIREISSEVR